MNIEDCIKKYKNLLEITKHGIRTYRSNCICGCNLSIALVGSFDQTPLLDTAEIVLCPNRCCKKGYRYKDHKYKEVKCNNQESINQYNNLEKAKLLLAEKKK